MNYTLDKTQRKFISNALELVMEEDESVITGHTVSVLERILNSGTYTEQEATLLNTINLWYQAKRKKK